MINPIAKFQKFVIFMIHNQLFRYRLYFCSRIVIYIQHLRLQKEKRRLKQLQVDYFEVPFRFYKQILDHFCHSHLLYKELIKKFFCICMFSLKKSENNDII